MRYLLRSVALVICFVASANAQSSARTEPVTEPELVYSWKDGETTFTFGHGEAVLSNRVQSGRDVGVQAS